MNDPINPKTAETTEPSGGNVSYYVCEVPNPKRLAAYTAECEDIIEALGMLVKRREQEGRPEAAFVHQCWARHCAGVARTGSGTLHRSMWPTGIV